MKKKILWIGAPIVLVAIVLGAMAMRGGGDEALEVQTARVDIQKIVQKVSATGKIQPKVQVKVSADVSAKITRLAVVEGQWVEKGTFLVELDRERYLAAVESAEANVRGAQSNAKLARENMKRTGKEFQRSKELMDQDLESAATFEDKESSYQIELARHESARFQVEQAEAVLKQTRDDLSKTTIYAPMSGTISDLRKEQGEIASSANTASIPPVTVSACSGPPGGTDHVGSNLPAGSPILGRHRGADFPIRDHVGPRVIHHMLTTGRGLATKLRKFGRVGT